MPLGFSKSIFNTQAAAAGDTGTTGWFGSQYDGNESQGAYNLVGDAGVGNTWPTATGGSTYSAMFWFKGTTSDIADSAWTVFRLLNTGDDSQTLTMTSTGIEPITQDNGGAAVASTSPASFSSNYLDDAWHHCAIEFVPGSTKIYLDGVSQTVSHVTGSTLRTPDNETRYFYINGRSFTSSLQDGSGANTRASSFQIADFWYKNADNGGIDLATNISSIYSSGWQNLGTNGTAGGTLPTPDVWLYVDSGGTLQSGGAISATWAEAFGSGSGGTWLEEAAGGPGYVNTFSSDANTLLLLPFDNNTTDDSGNETVTAQGSATFGSTAPTPYRGTHSADLSTNASYFDFPNPGWSFTGDFTVEAYVYASDWTTGDDRVIIEGRDGSNGSNPIFLFSKDSPGWYVYMGSTILQSGTGHAPSNNTWTHIALVRYGSTLSIYKDGTSIASTTNTSTFTFNTTTRIGTDYTTTSTRDFTGHIDNFRVSNIARYTGAFTPA